jgi:hypothetical protein
MIHLDDTTSADTTMMSSLGLEGLATTTEPQAGRRLGGDQGHLVAVFCRCFDGMRIGRDGPRIRRHGVKVRQDGQAGNGRKGGRVQRPRPRELPRQGRLSLQQHIFRHPRRQQHDTNGVDTVGVQGHGKEGTDEAATIHIEPVLVKGPRPTVTSLDGRKDNGLILLDFFHQLGGHVAAAGRLLAGLVLAARGGAASAVKGRQAVRAHERKLVLVGLHHGVCLFVDDLLRYVLIDSSSVPARKRRTKATATATTKQE